MNRSRHPGRFFSFGSHKTGFAEAFTLIEILLVVAVVSVLLVFGVIGFQNIGSSRGVSQGASDIASLLEFARNEAATRQSYVWVGVQTATNAGVAELQMAAVYSIDGTPTAGTNLTPLSRVLRVKQSTLVPYASLKSDTRNLLEGSVPVSEYLTNSAGISFSVGPVTFSNSITFTPRGEALLNGTPNSYAGFNPMIGLGVIPAREAAKGGSDNDAGVVLEGSTGTARVLRL